MRHSGLMALAFAGFLQCLGGAMSAGGVDYSPCGKVHSTSDCHPMARLSSNLLGKPPDNTRGDHERQQSLRISI